MELVGGDDFMRRVSQPPRAIWALYKGSRYTDRVHPPLLHSPLHQGKSDAASFLPERQNVCVLQLRTLLTSAVLESLGSVLDSLFLLRYSQFNDLLLCLSGLLVFPLFLL